MHKRSAYRDLAQAVLQLQAPDANILTQRSCARDPHTEILHKRSAYRDLAQVVVQDPDAEILTQRYGQEIRIKRSCTSSPTEEVLTQTSCADLAQVLLQDYAEEIFNTTLRYAQEIRIQRSCTSSPTEEILTQTSGTRGPHTPILRKCFYRIPLRRS